MPHDSFSQLAGSSDAIEGDLHPSYHEDYTPVTEEERNVGRIGVAGARDVLETLNPPKI